MVREKVGGSKDYVIRVLVSGILHREFSMIKAMESAAAEEIRAPAGISISFLADLTILRTCSANMKTGAILVLHKINV